MQRTLRTIGIILGVVLVLILIVAGVWQAVLRRAYPKVNGTVEIKGLSAPVDIYRDEYGIPHIYAQTTEDLFFAQGYVHAQDRFWQMEFWRRIGAGRLSEYFGEATLPSDIYLRTVGFAEIANQEYQAMDPESRKIVDAYSAGVNAYAQDRKPEQLGLEFALLKLQGIDVKIEPWTGVNSLTWAKVMSQDLGGNLDDELDRVQFIRAVGLDRAAELVPAYREDFPVIIPDEELEKLDLPTKTQTSQANYAFALMSLQPNIVGGYDPSKALVFGHGSEIGSNNWVISGKLTTTGKPLLANDPHLGIQMPSIWYEVGLHCVDAAGKVGRTEQCPYEVRGYSFAGVPGVIIGHNDRIAWGLTNVGPDTQDSYIERINSENPNQYEVNGKWQDMEIRRELITIHGQDKPMVLLVHSTRHGPIITDHGSRSAYNGFNVGPKGLPDDLEFSALSLKWTALQQNSTFRAIWLLDKASNWDEFREALSYFDSPSQNIVYADVEGNIGYQMPGLIPIRKGGDGSIPIPGWTDDYEWTGFIPYDELPRAYNPDQEYIATANQPVTSDKYPYLITTEYDHGFRAERINQMILNDKDKISVDDIKAIQGDDLSLTALDIIPYLKNLKLDDPAVSAARDRLLKWDGQTQMNSPDAAVYGYFWMAVVRNTYDDQLPENLWPQGGARTQDATYHLLQQPDNPWWDDLATADKVETRDDILKRSMIDGYQQGVKELGSDLSKWKWGTIHQATFANQTFGESGISLIEAIFNRGPVAVSGGSGMVNATNWSGDRDHPFEVSSIPSMRQIIDLGNLSASLMMNTTGQSGHPGQRNYDNFIDPWRLIQYHPTHWTREDVEKNSRNHLTLKPVP